MSVQDSQNEHIDGLIERVTFHSPESGFSVLRVKMKGQREPVTVVGTLPSVTAGEWLEASGRWGIDPEHGQQFKAEILKTTQPETVNGIKRYLGSGLIKGIGPHFADRLVKTFGKDVLDIIEKFPNRLLEVEGIGRVRLSRIKEAWAEQKSIRDIMIFLHSHGVGTSRAFRIYKIYGDRAIDRIRANPYHLSRDIWGIGFKTADQLAASIGVAKDSELRARAGVEYVLQKLTDKGHCAYSRRELASQAANELDIPLTTIERAIDQAIEDERLVEREMNGSTLVYLTPLDTAERLLAWNLVKLSLERHSCPPINVPGAVKWIQGRLGHSLAPAQQKALEQAVKRKVLVITGGPGVGKTTLVNAIVQVFRAKKQQVILCAPTGRAAKRLSDATGMEAKTIHRLLEFDPANMKFKHDGDKPLRGDVFIVDESSMIDLVLAHQLVRAIPSHAAFIMVGDVDQLPSVGPGCVLRDIINSGVIPVCLLTEVFRQAAQSSIIINAHRINRGNLPEWPKTKVENPRDTDFYFIEMEQPEKAAKLIVQLFRDKIPRQFGFASKEDIQILTPMQKGELGARNLNLVLQQAVNPEGDYIQRYGWKFRAGDKVMQIINNYDKDVFNGDIGIIASIDHEQKEMLIRFDERTIKYDFDELDELILSYAVTIHKSQGSEYPCVIVPVHTQHYILLQRNLLYTAVTRGRKLVVLVGTRKALEIAVKKVESSWRVTSLKERLIEQASVLSD